MLTRSKSKVHKLHRHPDVRVALKALSRSLAIFRSNRGITLQQMAERVGCSDKSIWNIESATNCPSWPVYLAICRVIGTDRPPLT